MLLMWRHISWKILVFHFVILILLYLSGWILISFAQVILTVSFFFNKSEYLNTVCFPGRTYTCFINDIFFIFYVYLRHNVLKCYFSTRCLEKYLQFMRKLFDELLNIKKGSKLTVFCKDCTRTKSPSISVIF